MNGSKNKKTKIHFSKNIFLHTNLPNSLKNLILKKITEINEKNNIKNLVFFY
jgi:hypothetical protein